MTDIHDYQKKLKQALDRVARSTKLPPADKELLLKFSWVLQTQRVSNGRVAKYVNHLSVISETLPQLTRSGRGLGDASKEDIERLSIWIYSSKYRPNTQHDQNCALSAQYYLFCDGTKLQCTNRVPIPYSSLSKSEK